MMPDETQLPLVSQEKRDYSGHEWTVEENIDTVKIYMAMLKLQLSKLNYSKTEYRNKLLPLLNDRKKGAAEYKFENISAVLIEHHLPYIEGYKPSYHYQSSLEDVVISWIERDKTFPTIVRKAAALPLKVLPPIGDLNDILVKPPDRRPKLQSPQKVNERTAFSSIDYIGREASNTKLGKWGEEFVLGFEEKRLSYSGHADLAGKIEWVSSTRGDGLGYDIQSYGEDGQGLFIEVKTTNQGLYFPFLASAKEVDMSENLSDCYSVYRVFNFSKNPKLFILPGSISAMGELHPTTYEVRL